MSVLGRAMLHRHAEMCRRPSLERCGRTAQPTSRQRARSLLPRRFGRGSVPRGCGVSRSSWGERWNLSAAWENVPAGRGFGRSCEAESIGVPPALLTWCVRRRTIHRAKSRRACRRALWTLHGYIQSSGDAGSGSRNHRAIFHARAVPQSPSGHRPASVPRAGRRAVREWDVMARRSELARS